jgi:putative endonuclease
MIGWLYRAADALRRRSYPGNHGRIGEDLAHRYLRKRGCTVVARNYRTLSGSGEIDLVVWHGKTLAFVEVKTRATAEFGEPESAVDPEKQRHLHRAARDYARRAGVEWQLTRFDIVSIVLGPPVTIDWIQDAFTDASVRSATL